MEHDGRIQSGYWMNARHRELVVKGLIDEGMSPEAAEKWAAENINVYRPVDSAAPVRHDEPPTKGTTR